jgi:SnoaL-like domain
VAGRSADRAAAWDTDELKTSSCVADGSGMCWCPRHAAAETVHVDSSNERSNDAGRLAPAAVYRRFLDALNRQDLTEAEAWVDPTRYRENCVGFTDGYVNWADAQTSVQTIWKGLPDLHVKLHDLATGPDFAIARGTVSGTALGRSTGHRQRNITMRRATSTTSDLTGGRSSSGYNRPTYSARCASCTDASSAWPGQRHAPPPTPARPPDPIRLVPSRTGFIAAGVSPCTVATHAIRHKRYLGELRRVKCSYRSFHMGGSNAPVTVSECIKNDGSAITRMASLSPRHEDLHSVY